MAFLPLIPQTTAQARGRLSKPPHLPAFAKALWLRLPLPPSMGSLSLHSLGVFILTNPLNLGPEQITIPQLSLSATCPSEVTTPLTAFLGGERLGYKQVRGSCNTGLRFLTPCNAETEPVESALFPYGREPLPTPCPTLLLKPRLEDRTGVEFE